MCSVMCVIVCTWRRDRFDFLLPAGPKKVILYAKANDGIQICCTKCDVGVSDIYSATNVRGTEKREASNYEYYEPK